MQIFLSWSGERSKALAFALWEWLPQVVNAFEPFMSEEDIKKGERGFAVLADQLSRSKCGILCITPENREKPWIMFEAGALGKSVDGRVHALLFGLEPGQLHAALGQFQATRCDREDIFKLVSALNGSLGEQKMVPDRLTKSFDMWWPELEKAIARVRDMSAQEPAPAKRSADEMAAETLEIVRQLARDLRLGTAPARHVSPLEDFGIWNSEEHDAALRRIAAEWGFLGAFPAARHVIGARLFDEQSRQSAANTAAESSAETPTKKP